MGYLFYNCGNQNDVRLSDGSIQPSRGRMAASTESARLRVVGQELEQRRICDFEVLVDDGGYRVRGTVPQAVVPQPPPLMPPIQAGKPAWSLRKFFKKPDVENPCPEPAVPAETWECSYTHSDIDRLDDWYRTLRKSSGLPDDYAPSQVLRVVGAYAEQRKWTLEAVSRSRQVIDIRHRDADGVVETTSRKFAELYDFCFHMSRGRKRLSEAV